jgi:hypothetical protein
MGSRVLREKMPAVSLTDYQLSSVRNAACNVPPTWRSRLLAAVLEHILPNSTPSDEAIVAEAVSAINLEGSHSAESYACGGNF